MEIVRKTLTVADTVKILRKAGMHTSVKALEMGIRQGTYPFGDCVTVSRDNCTVYKRPLAEWMLERGEFRDGKLCIETLNVTDASELMRLAGFRMTPERLKLGIQQGVYPFGDCVTIKAPCHTVYAKLLREWMDRRDGPEEQYDEIFKGLGVVV